MSGRTKAENSTQAPTMELLIGTWMAMGVMADALIEAGAIKRADLVSMLQKAELQCATIDARHIPIRALRQFVDGSLGSVLSASIPTPPAAVSLARRSPAASLTARKTRARSVSSAA